MRAVVLVAAGLPRVRNMSKLGSTLPAPKYHDGPGETPKLSVAPLTKASPGPKVNGRSKYTGRSARMPTDALMTVEKPTTPGPTPSALELASTVTRDFLGRNLVLLTVPPPSRP